MRSGEAALAVGTHALLTESVDFARLGLVIIDEQHRFGVEQRARLRAKSGAPHTLLHDRDADSAHARADEVRRPGSLDHRRAAAGTNAGRDLSSSAQAGRTWSTSSCARTSTRGQQAYVVAPAIDAGETALRSALAEAEYIQREVFPELRVAVLHGRMPPKEKDAVMAAFKSGEIDVLVATTVVEVGVDVPNASVMVILDAHRYGLAQLHQLRGRVGRGVAKSYLHSRRSGRGAQKSSGLKFSHGRTTVSRSPKRTCDCGVPASSPGTAQAGLSDGTIGNIVDDFAIYMQAKAAAEAIVNADPELARPEHEKLRVLIDEVAAARALLVTA